jgi:hypothetical protein
VAPAPSPEGAPPASASRCRSARIGRLVAPGRHQRAAGPPSMTNRASLLPPSCSGVTPPRIRRGRDHHHRPRAVQQQRMGALLRSARWSRRARAVLFAFKYQRPVGRTASEIRKPTSLAHDRMGCTGQAVKRSPCTYPGQAARRDRPDETITETWKSWPGQAPKADIGCQLATVPPCSFVPWPGLIEDVTSRFVPSWPVTRSGKETITARARLQQSNRTCAGWTDRTPFARVEMVSGLPPDAVEEAVLAQLSARRTVFHQRKAK